MTEDEKRELGFKIGRQVRDITSGYYFENNQDLVEVLGIALFWYMGCIFALSKVGGVFDEGSSAV